MEIIPAIDIIDGKCVRLIQGNYSQCKIYSEDPVSMAKKFEASGLKRLHVVDLEGAKSSRVVNMRVLEQICKSTGLTVDFGGGIKSDGDLRDVFNAGAALACIGSMAQTRVEKVLEWIDLYGGEKIIIGVDSWNTKVCIQGWKKVTGTTIFELIDRYKERIKYLMCTDITRDGTLEGTAVNLYADLRKRYPLLNLIASGGIGGMDDLERLAHLGLYGAIVGKAIYENKITFAELRGRF